MGITFRSVSHFELSFIYGTRYGSKNFLMHLDQIFPLPFDEKTKLPPLN